MQRHTLTVTAFALSALVSGAALAADKKMDDKKKDGSCGGDKKKDGSCGGKK